MNVFSRGVKNALRSPLRSGAIILMLAISIALILSMLVARSSVNTKIEEVKASAGTTITIAPAGVQGFSGGGDPLSTEQVATITATDHITSVSSTLSDQLGSDDTSLEAALELGSFGQRQQRFESSDSGDDTTAPEMPANTGEDGTSERPAMTPRTTVTGTTNSNSVSTDGSDLTITSGTTIDSTSSDLVALIGTDLAEKNSLSVGDTFTAYEKTITVKGIFETGNTFQDSGVIMPLTTLQTLTNQAGAVSSVTATVDSSDNVDSVVSALENSLGDDADITSQAEQAEQSVSSLESISGLALAGVIGSAIAGSVIILLAMVMIVRERRREIGVVKAIGGSNIKVVTQFIVEALTLTAVGAVVGLAFGTLVSGPMTTSLVSGSSNSSNTTSESRGPGGQNGPSTGGPGGFAQRGAEQINQNFTQITSTLTPQIFASAVGITFLIAILGSAIPAWFIARVRPAEVLRTE